MKAVAEPGNNTMGAVCALSAILCFSFVDLGIKLLSEGYALHQVVFLRSLVSLTFFLAVILPLGGGWSVLRTRRPGAHLLRGAFIVCANVCLFLGLAALPIADAVAIFFVSPLAIAVMSVIFLGETVGPRRWAAIVLGLVGVLLIVQPGTEAFQAASLLPAISALLYGAMHMVTRRVRTTESATTMTFYVIITFLVSSAIIGLFIGDGRYEGGPHPALEFLLRAWAPVTRADMWIILMLGVAGVMGSWLISQAYRLSEAAFAAPFEYAAMPISIFWGVAFFDTWPQLNAWAGIVLIVGSGLYMLWRESAAGRPKPRYRR
ncbi:EamA family transporter [Pelagivirga sediminicola]|uniref:EamA family transporter n=1 Tax=Pelagivirga sediminicola TaxID=2170575 RepID=A0A2T7G682_9RHOB|nr:DMT family transporter [Pelagivirga sediminicola]PVA09877.1 EamA family transporter [Pelagivirga sediminicola]